MTYNVESAKTAINAVHAGTHTSRCRVYTLMYGYVYCRIIGKIQTGEKLYNSRGILLHSTLLQQAFSQCFAFCDYKMMLYFLFL